MKTGSGLDQSFLHHILKEPHRFQRGNIFFCGMPKNSDSQGSVWMKVSCPELVWHISHESLINEMKARIREEQMGPWSPRLNR